MIDLACIEGMASEPAGGTTTVSADAEALMGCTRRSLKELTKALDRGQPGNEER